MTVCKKIDLKRVGSMTCSMLLVAGLCWPCGAAVAVGGGEIDGTYEEKTAVAAEYAIARDESDAGLDALTRYLDGEVLSNEDLLSIDIDALAEIDPDLAAEIADLQETARAELAAEEASVGGIEPADAADIGDDGTGADDAESGAEAYAEPDAESGAEAYAEPDAESGVEAASIDEAGAEAASADDTDIPGVEIDASFADDDAEHVDGTAAELAVARFAAPTEPVEADKRSEAVDAGQTETPETAGEPAYPAWSYAGDTALVSRNPGVSLTTTKFIAVIGEQARELAAENDLYASVMIAQAVLESGSGNSGLAQAPNFNLFGIKGSYEGASVTMRTQEDDGTGSYYPVDAAFRRYPSYRESLEDYARLMSRALYLPAHKSATESFAEACGYLQGTYATSTSYAAALEGIIVAYDLTRYDEPLGYELEGDYPAVVDAQTGEVLGVGAAALAEWAGELEAQERGSDGLEDAPEGARELAVEQRCLADLAAEAAGHLGADYVWGASGPDEFDCSGLVQASYASALGVALPRTTHYQCLLGEDVDFADLIVGDLVFFADAKGVVYHVGMYLGEGCYIESTVPGGVQVTAMEERTPTFAKRVLPMREVAKDGDDGTLESLLKAIPSSATQHARRYLACIASEIEFGPDTSLVSRDL